MYFVIKKSTNDQYYFVIKSANNEIVVTSESYHSKYAVEMIIESIKNEINPESLIVDMTK
ncbi:YegP family protein [Enterococcus sp. C76]|uniref:YegP family protein n=1 Tax=Enterococcus sp. C76 TaxID=3231334 RepID=UPI002EC6799C|nr:YegP family protein [Enterococcus faecium]